MGPHLAGGRQVRAPADHDAAQNLHRVPVSDCGAGMAATPDRIGFMSHRRRARLPHATKGRIALAPIHASTAMLRTGVRPSAWACVSIVIPRGMAVLVMQQAHASMCTWNSSGIGVDAASPSGPVWGGGM